VRLSLKLQATIFVAGCSGVPSISQSGLFIGTPPYTGGL
jgi:hypothetical protein